MGIAQLLFSVAANVTFDDIADKLAQIRAPRFSDLAV